MHCSVCPYTSLSSYNLKRHVRAVHSGERGFPCSHCTYAASRADDLAKHVQRRHRGAGVGRASTGGVQRAGEGEHALEKREAVVREAAGESPSRSTAEEEGEEEEE